MTLEELEAAGARIQELLEANAREVERRRSAEAEAASYKAAALDTAKRLGDVLVKLQDAREQCEAGERVDAELTAKVMRLRAALVALNGLGSEPPAFRLDSTDEDEAAHRAWSAEAERVGRIVESALADIAPEPCHAGRDGDCNWSLCPQAVDWKTCCPRDVEWRAWAEQHAPEEIESER